MKHGDAVRISIESRTYENYTIYVTGNVLCDHLTDNLPIIELVISANIMSIVTFLKSIGQYETSAGVSEPKDVKQFV